ncbi:InlB B-repeat-containing protein, partial [Paenibacillus sinopodophylli]|uniref:InlB B-repeat-containing protein n=1 Tax=Paenibacillus sinopodophylli TaxID=1837342 RepID=UPI001485C651
MQKKLKAVPLLLVFMMIFSMFPMYVSAANVDIGSERVDVETNESTDSYVITPPVVVGDKVVIAWYDQTDHLHTSVINADGTPGSFPAFTISPKTNDNSDDILIKELSNGNLLIYWYSGSSGTGFTDTYFKIINQVGSEVVGATKINSEAGELNRFTDVAELSNGNLAFVWTTSSSNYALRRFAPNGTAVDASQLSITAIAGTPGSQYSHKIVSNDNGRFMIMISYNNPDYKGMVFDNNGSMPIQVGGQNSFVISTHNDAANGVIYLRLLSNGKFLTVYQKKTTSDDSSRSTAFRIYNADGTPFAAETVVGATHTWGSVGEPIITDDGFVLSYTYNDLINPSNYLVEYSNSGVLQNDLSSLLPAVNAEYGVFFPFRDVDGKLSLLVNDVEAGKSDYNTWLLRHPAAPLNYTVTFKDWDGDVLKTELVNTGSDATAPASPTRTGYTFTGWDTAFTNVTASTVVTAEYAINQYTISFNSNAGSAVADVQADYGTKIAAPTAPTRVGYTFHGWYKEVGLTNVWNFSVDMVPAVGITLYAKWSIQTHTVTFKNWNGDTLKTDTVDYGSGAAAPADPTRTGYTFTGWDTAFTNVTANTVVTAEYAINQYTISFNSNAGSAVADIQADYGTKIAAPTAPTRVGYTFDGWYKEAGLTNVWNFNVDTVPAVGITLYAKWSIQTHTVTFKNWNGDTLKTDTVDYGSGA